MNWEIGIILWLILVAVSAGYLQMFYGAFSDVCAGAVNEVNELFKWKKDSNRGRAVVWFIAVVLIPLLAIRGAVTKPFRKAKEDKE